MEPRGPRLPRGVRRRARSSTARITGAEGDSFNAGTLGKYTVGTDGTVLLGKPYVFDKSNIDQFNF